MYFQIECSPSSLATSTLKIINTERLYTSFIDQLLRDAKEVIPNRPLINLPGSYYKLNMKQLLEQTHSKAGNQKLEIYQSLIILLKQLGYRGVEGSNGDEILFFKSDSHNGFYADTSNLQMMSWIVDVLVNYSISLVTGGIYVPFKNILDINILVRDVVFVSQGLSSDFYNSILEYIHFEDSSQEPVELIQNFPNFKEWVVISRHLLISKGKISDKNLRVLNPRFMMVNVMASMGPREIKILFLDNLLTFLEGFQHLHKQMLNNPKFTDDPITKLDPRTEGEMDNWMRNLRNELIRLDISQ